MSLYVKYTKERLRQISTELGSALSSRGLKLSCAESCTGGMIAQEIVANTGASAYFLGSVVAYSNQAKETFLGVNQASLDRFGAVSGQVAQEMARGVLFRSGADLAVSVTGIAGPDGGSQDKPVGTVFFGLADHSRARAFHDRISLPRNEFREHCTALALDLVRCHALKLELPLKEQGEE